MNEDIKSLIINPVFYTFERLNLLIKLGTIKLEDAVKEILDLKMAKNIWCFAYYIEGAPIKELADAIIATNDTQYIYEFALSIKGAPIKELADAIIATNNADYIYEFAQYVKGAPIKKLADAIIATKNAKYICEFAFIKGAPIKELADAIIATKNAQYIYKFAYANGAPIKELADAIIATKNAEYIYEFACLIEGAPIEELADAIIETQNVNCIYYFVKSVKGAPVNRLIEKLLTLEISIKNMNSLVATTSDSNFLYKCANCFDKIYTPIFVNQLIKYREYKLLANILINIKLGEENLNQNNVECYIAANLNMVLNIMVDCKDKSIIKNIALNAKSPYIAEYFNKLYSVLNDKKIYKYFFNAENPLSEEDKKIIDELFENLPKVNQRTILFYIDDLSRNLAPMHQKAIILMDNLQEKFKERLKAKKAENPKTIEKLKKEKTIYTYFLSIKNPLTEEDKKVIDQLFENLSEENKKIVNDYINGVSKSDISMEKKAISFIDNLRDKFKKYIETKKAENPKTIEKLKEEKTIYTYFLSIKNPLTEEDKKVIDKLFDGLDEKLRSTVIEYIKGNIKYNTEDGKTAYNTINSLRKKFIKYLNPEKLKEEKTIYTYFLKIKEPLTEEDKKVIDKLFENLSEETKKIVNDYIKEIDNSMTSTRKKAIDILNSLQQKYKDYLNESYAQSNNYKNERLEMLMDKYELLNKYFFQILGYSVSDFLYYQRNKMEEIRSRGITAFDEVLEVFINESLEFIEELKRKRSR